MIIIQPLNGTWSEHFENFDQLLECIITTETLKLAEKTSNLKPMNWSFRIYPTNQVAILFAIHKKPPEVLKEALEERFHLIEICVRNDKNPLYIVLIPNVDIDYLKKKWCVDYCTYYSLVVREV
ncbi:MAG: hypothetical protein ACOH2E_01155 [Candidatus Paracaedibacter sp.]